MQAGPRDKLVTLLRAGAGADDGYTRQPGAFAPFGREWAAVIYGSGQERRDAAQQSTAVPATFRMLRNDRTLSLTPQDRLALAGVEWTIMSAVPLGRDGVEVTAVLETPAPAAPAGS